MAERAQGLGAAGAGQDGDPKASPEDKKAAGERLLGNLGPFGDQTDASYNKNIALLMENSIAHVAQLLLATKL